MTIFTGDSGNNTIFKTDADTVIGLGGDDRLSAGVMIGGQGNDYYYVTSSSDLIFENSGEGNDSVYSSIHSYTLSAYVENLTLSSALFGNAARNAYGNSLGNIINGNQFDNYISTYGGNDIIFSGGGDDEVNAGSGDDYIWAVGDQYGKGELDTLIGGGGNDTFVLASDSQDRLFYNNGNPNNSGLEDYALIQDFEIGNDKIVLLGNASKYYLASTESLGISNSVGSGMAVLLNGQGYAANELIAVLEGVSSQQMNQGSLTNSSIFSYV